MFTFEHHQEYLVIDLLMNSQPVYPEDSWLYYHVFEVIYNLA